MITKPNFLILGAAKAGTTSLYAYLRQHPQIYLTSVKEPGFFAYGEAPLAWQGPGVERVQRNSILTRPQYEQLFAGVTQETAFGEASVTNIWPRACARIQQYAPDAKFLALLRQPADRAYSHFLYNYRLGVEPLSDFTAALAAEPSRVRQGWFPMLCYRQMSHYSADLQNYLAHFPREQLRIYLYDDFVAQPVPLLQDIFAFLGVDPNFTPDVTVRYNTARMPRNVRLFTFLRRPHWIKTWLRPLFPVKLRGRLARQVQSYNWKKPSPLDPQLRAALTRDFAPEIAQLQDLLGRDLSHWLAPAPSR